MLSKEEIKEAVEQLFPEGFGSYKDELRPDKSIDGYSYNDRTASNGVYSWKQENSWGGEGDGADMSVVYKITRLSDSKVGFIQFDGEYSSWDSSQWDDDYTVVAPREVMKTRYFQV